VNLLETNVAAGNTKPEIYGSLYAINHSLQEVLRHLDRLKAAGVLTATFEEVHRLAVEEMRSEINSTATNSLYASECGAAHAFQQLRLALEQQLRDLPAAQPQPEVPAASG